MVVSLILLVTACDASGSAGGSGKGGSSGSAESSAPPAPAKTVELPRFVGGKVHKRPGLPTRVPLSLDGLPTLPFDGVRRSFVMSYRPYEDYRYGSTWADEESAVLSKGGQWFRVPFDELGLDDSDDYTDDQLGPGQLSASGEWLAFRSRRGVMVLNLTSGRIRHYLQPGSVGSFKWAPDSDTLFFHKFHVRRPESFKVDMRTDRVVETEPKSGLSLGFSPEGDECHAVSEEADAVQFTCGPADDPESVTELALPGAVAGHGYSNWSSEKMVVLGDAGRGYDIYAYDRSTGRLVGTLEMKGRVGWWFSIKGWLDDDSLLISKDRELLTWAPMSGDLEKIAVLPPSDIRRITTASVEVQFPPLPYR